MPMLNPTLSWRAAASAILLLAASASVTAQPYGFGRTATAQAITAWNIDIDALGNGLPPGRGTVAEGEQLFSQQCAACHGAKGQGGPADALVGGTDLKRFNPKKTVGNFWPYATTLYDFIQRAMPYNTPQSLKASEVYALTAWILHKNDLLAADAELDAISLPKVQMSNRLGFVRDSRPDTANTACKECR